MPDSNFKTKEPKRVCITGAAGRIAYSLIQSLAKGDVFGHDQPLILHLLDIEKSYHALEGIALEIQDLASNVVVDCMMTTSAEEALTGADLAVLIASHPHLPGMERVDLLRANTRIFKETGQVLERVAKRSIKVLVVANPCNTNALITMTYAPSIHPSQFTGLSMLDHNRTVAQVSRRLSVSVEDVRNVVVWGNHSSTMFPDVSHASLRSPTGDWEPLTLLGEGDWARVELLEVVRNRYKEIINKRGMTTMSTGKAIADHLQNWMHGTPEGSHVSMAVPSNGEYNVPKGVFFSYPVTVTCSSKVSIMEGLDLDDYSKEMISKSYQELKHEAEEALQIALEE